jgi:FdrA protein
MTVVRNEVRKGTYLDSVALMRMSRTIAARPGVIECGLMMATPANKRIMAEAGVLDATGEAAAPGDLVIALAAADSATADTALIEARALLDKPKATSGPGAAWRPKTIRAAVQADPAATLALISVPGAFAAAEARKALNRGLHVMLFSDNVPLADEVALKQDASARGLLVMGPDCGTAILGGVPMAFANVVPRGPVGIVGASGTGIQEVTCLIAQGGSGISHAIGTGGRDLKAEVGGLTTLAAIDLLDRDAATTHIVIISKPPAARVAAQVLARVGRSNKPFTICFLGGDGAGLPANARAAATLEDAARLALGHDPMAPPPAAGRALRPIRGLYAGGTLCAEAQILLRQAGADVASNVPVPGAHAADAAVAHRILDLGDDAYTQGRPHPMIEPVVRDAPLARALADPTTGVVLIDCVLGYGGHRDPAGALVRVIGARGARGAGGPPVVASVTGTDADPQHRTAQVRTLEAAGVRVAVSNAAAVRLALDLARH